MEVKDDQRELIFKGNKRVKDKKISIISIGKSTDDYLNEGKKLNCNNIIKLKYRTDIIHKATEILNREFVEISKNKAKIVLNNKQYNLKAKVRNKNIKISFKIKIKFLENVINLDSMFNGCEMLISANFSNQIT